MNGFHSKLPSVIKAAARPLLKHPNGVQARSGHLSPRLSSQLQPYLQLAPFFKIYYLQCTYKNPMSHETIHSSIPENQYHYLCPSMPPCHLKTHLTSAGPPHGSLNIFLLFVPSSPAVQIDRRAPPRGGAPRPEWGRRKGPVTRNPTTLVA